MMRQWMWQSCDELGNHILFDISYGLINNYCHYYLGYFQTAPAENSLRSTLIDANWHIQVCKKLFGDFINGPKISWTNNFYGYYFFF